MHCTGLNLQLSKEIDESSPPVAHNSSDIKWRSFTASVANAHVQGIGISHLGTCTSLHMPPAPAGLIAWHWTTLAPPWHPCALNGFPPEPSGELPHHMHTLIVPHPSKALLLGIVGCLTD